MRIQWNMWTFYNHNFTKPHTRTTTTKHVSVLPPSPHCRMTANSFKLKVKQSLSHHLNSVGWGRDLCRAKLSSNRPPGWRGPSPQPTQLTPPPDPSTALHTLKSSQKIFAGTSISLISDARSSHLVHRFDRRLNHSHATKPRSLQ